MLSGSDERLFVNRMIDLVGNDAAQGRQRRADHRPEGAAGRPPRTSARRTTKGAVVALDPSTGAILAMVTQPSYNPNLIASHDPTRPSVRSTRWNSPDDRRCSTGRIAETYPPGSTFKLVTAAAALSNGYTPESTVQGGPAVRPAAAPATRLQERERLATAATTRSPCTQALRGVVQHGVRRARRRSSAPTTLQRPGREVRLQRRRPRRAAARRQRLPDADLDEAQTALSAIGQFDVRATPLQMAMVAAGDRQRRRRDEALRRPAGPAPRPRDRSTRPARGAAPGDRRRRPPTAHPDDGRRRRERHRHQRRRSRRHGRPARPAPPARRGPGAVRLDGRPSRRPNNPQVAVAVLVEQTGVGRDEISGNGWPVPSRSR